MTIILGIIIFMFLIVVVNFWRNRKIVSLLLLAPVFLVLLFFGFVLYNSWYETNPNSLDFKVQKEGQSISVTGVWNQPLDTYRFPTDFIVFFIPKDEEITDVKRSRVEDYEEMDRGYLVKSIQESINRENPPQSAPQIYDIETSKEFNFSFVLPENVDPNEVTIFYAHTREEPMDDLEFWFKKIDLK